MQVLKIDKPTIARKISSKYGGFRDSYRSILIKNKKRSKGRPKKYEKDC